MKRKKESKPREEAAAGIYFQRGFVTPKESVAGKMMRHLVTRVFDGSTSAMVVSLIETSDIDADELTELRRIISRKAKEQQK